MTTSSANQLFRYRGYLNPKTYIPREALFYFIGCSFFGLLLFLLIYFVGGDPLFAVACSGAGSLVLLFTLIKINNRFFNKDKEMLSQLIVTEQIDSLMLLSAFFKDIQLQFEKQSLSYFGAAEILSLSQVDLTPLFKSVFRQEGAMMLGKFMNQHGNFFRFVQDLTLVQREVLYRFYLGQNK